jgi:predicted dehydrogenase
MAGASIAWGVLSTARIGTTKVIPAMQQCRRGQVVAIASRDKARGTAVARELGIPGTFASYEALLADPAIDAIYNPLPNHLHVPWTLRALAAGKHVLCEKPIALSATEAESLIAASEAAGKQVVEAFMVRHHPQWQRVRELLRGGTLGALRAVQISFSFNNADPANIRNRPETGGGAWYDIGCYAVLAARYLFEAEPLRVVALARPDAAMGIDRLSSGLMEFPGGRHAGFTCSMQMVRHQRVQVLCEAGRIELPVPFTPPPDKPARLLVDDGTSADAGSMRVEEFFPCDQYTLQGDAAAAYFLGEAANPFPLEDSLRNMRVIDALRRSAESAQWETP